MAHYVAFIEFLARDKAGELEMRTIEQDVTDEVKEALAEGASADSLFEEMADRLYWKNCDGKADFHSVNGGGVKVTE